MRRCLHVQRAALRCSARRRLSSVGSASPTTNYKFVSLTPELFPQGYGGDLEEDKFQYVFEGGGGDVVMERRVTEELLKLMTQIEGEPAGTPLRLDDDDWTCDACGQLNSASKSKRMFCATCEACRRGLPRRAHYFLTGHRGTGKSVAMNYAVDAARKRGWLCLHVPKAYNMMNEGDYVVPSEHHEGLFEQPSTSRDLIEAFSKAHAGQLSRVPLKDVRHRERWGLAEKDSTLAGLIAAALEPEQLDSSSTALADIRAELSLTVEYPVLIAIDEYTSMFSPMTNYWFAMKNLRPEQMVAIRALRQLDPTTTTPLPLARGFELFAESQAYKPKFKLKQDLRQSFPHMPVELRCTPYTKSEFIATCHRYLKVLTTSNFQGDRDMLSMYMATQGNPRELFRRMLVLENVETVVSGLQKRQREPGPKIGVIRAAQLLE